MISSEQIDKKFKSLNEKINSVSDKFGEEVVSELMNRIEFSLESFLNDFKISSSKSFELYWKKQEEMKIRNDDKINNELIQDENIPKFISEYDNNKK